MGDVLGSFVLPLAAHFEVRGSADQLAADLAEDIGSYPDRVLMEAAKALRQSHRYQRFPLPAECIGACQRAADMLAPPPPKPRRIDRNELEPERTMRSPWAEQAAREGWIHQLDSHFRRTSEEPTRHQVAAMINRQRQFDAWPEADAPSIPQGLRAMLKGLWASMRERHERRAEAVMGRGRK